MKNLILSAILLISTHAFANTTTGVTCEKNGGKGQPWVGMSLEKVYTHGSCATVWTFRGGASSILTYREIINRNSTSIGGSIAFNENSVTIKILNCRNFEKMETFIQNNSLIRINLEKYFDGEKNAYLLWALNVDQPYSIETENHIYFTQCTNSQLIPEANAIDYINQH